MSAGNTGATVLKPLEDQEEPERQVEFGAEDDDEGVLDLASFGQAVLWGTDWTVETITALLKRGNIDLNPRFQRRDAWNRKAKSRFIESIILGLPIPQIVLAESRDQRGKYIVLDGKQRLLSLLQFSGLATDPRNNGFRLYQLEARTDLNGKTLKSIERNVALNDDLSAFHTHTIRATVIRNWPSLSFLHLVFQRLNTGSLKLSPQELRQAIAPGAFTDFTDDFTREQPAIYNLLGRSSPDPRMRDVELFVRFVAFRLFISDYEGRMKDFLDTVCLRLNGEWAARASQIQIEGERFVSSIAVLQEVFGDRLARRKDSALFNRSIFDALSFYAAQFGVAEAMSARKADVLRAYENLTANEMFQEAVGSDTAGLPHTADRLRLWGEALSASIELPLQIPRLETRPSGETRLTV